MRLICGRGRYAWLALVFACCSLPALSQGDPRQAAFSLEQQGKLAEAEAAWRALAQAHPSNPEPFAHLGLLEARQEHYTEAIAFYRKAMALDPLMPRLRFNLGLAYFKDGEYKEALQQFNPLLKADAPDSDEAHRLAVLVGMSHFGLGEYAAAAPFLKQAADADAANLPLLLTLAHSCLLSKQYQCVLDAFHRIVALNPDSAEAHVLAGEALDEMKDPVGAIRELRAAVAANPKEPNVHFGLGYLLWTQGQTQEAAQQFQAELDNDPEHAQAMLYLADSQIQLNRLEDARLLLERVVKINPANAMGHLDLGIVYTEAGRNEDALRELKQAAALKPDDVSAHYRLGRLYRAMGKTAEAKVEFDKSKSLNKAADEGLIKVMSRVPHPDSAQQGTIPVPAVK
ncbi:MAG: tetratricopeptide repeat protein [Terracidiphilus sp.]